ncbi:MAG TPA: Holliday junction resolvase RuvX, partial [Synergistetes bacterium]|nr:Holliday junction resolvase RuvX [Synergistota bacterium]
MKRTLGLDVGKVRIGVAISDPLGTFAQGIAVLDAGKNWISLLRNIIEEKGVGTLVVGMPVRTDGSLGPEAIWIGSVIDILREEFSDLNITSWDERFTTTSATRSLLECDMSRK